MIKHTLLKVKSEIEGASEWSTVVSWRRAIIGKRRSSEGLWKGGCFCLADPV